MLDDDIEAILTQVYKTVFGDTKFEFDEEHMIGVLLDQMAYVMRRCKTEEQAKKRALQVAQNWCNDCTYDRISLLPDDAV